MKLFELGSAPPNPSNNPDAHPLNLIHQLWMRELGKDKGLDQHPAVLEALCQASQAHSGYPIHCVIECNHPSDIFFVPLLNDILAAEELRIRVWAVMPTSALASMARRELMGLEGFITISSKGALRSDLKNADNWPLFYTPALTVAPSDLIQTLIQAVELKAVQHRIGASYLDGSPADLWFIPAIDQLPEDHNDSHTDYTFQPSIGTIAECENDVLWDFAARTVNIKNQDPSEIAHFALHTDRGCIASTFSAGGIKLPFPTQITGLKKIQSKIVITGQKNTRVMDFDVSFPPHLIPAEAVTCFLNRGGAGNPMIKAFAEGLGAQLAFAEDETGPRPCIPLVWGVLRGSDKVISFAELEGRFWFYVDHAYFGRGHQRNYRVSRNAYEAGAVKECPPDRSTALDIQTKPWNRDGSIVLVCPPTEFFMAAHRCESWKEDTLAHLARVTDREIVVREKPLPGETAEPLESVLRRTHALVTHSSNVAVEAALLGTPVFVSPMSAAAPIGSTSLDDIETPVYPDREAWISHLAYSQFSFEEIRDGTAWRLLMENELRPLVNVQ